MNHAEQLAAIERLVEAGRDLIGRPGARELAINVVATLALDAAADPRAEVHASIMRRWRGDPYRVHKGKRAIKLPEVAPCFCVGLIAAHVVELEDALVAAWFARA